MVANIEGNIELLCSFMISMDAKLGFWVNFQNAALKVKVPLLQKCGLLSNFTSVKSISKLSIVEI